MKTTIDWLDFQANALFHPYQKTVWLIGSGRSGTTWIGDLVSYTGPYRKMMEPFHPTMIPPASFLIPHLYARPGNSVPQLERLGKKVFKGKLYHPRSNAGNWPYRYGQLLIKDIYANLFAKWVQERFPEVKILFLIRNPFAVALSKTKRSNWFWLKDPRQFLKQPELMQDHLGPFKTLIESVPKENNPFLNHILTWAIINYVPFRQFAGGPFTLLFYEHFCLDPVGELEGVVEKIGGWIPKTARFSSSFGSKASRFSEDRSKQKHRNPLMAWKSEVDPANLDRGMEILECFGFADLYDWDTGLPRP